MPKKPYLSVFKNRPDNVFELVIDESAAENLTRVQTPWLVGPCEWTPKFVRKAVVWLCGIVNKPILKLTYKDYIENSLGQLLEKCGTYDKINIRVFNDLQHTITGWPGGKPNADDSTRPTPSLPYPKRVLIFSPHPDDDVISMGGTFIRLVEQNYINHRDLKFYAEQLSLTPKHISLVVKQSSGKSATEWIEKYVTLDAITQLTSTDKSIKEIAYDLGFPSQSFFGKYFCRVVGISPAEYRKAHKK